MGRMPAGKYTDVADLPEDERLRKTGLTVMENPGKIVGLVTDHGPEYPGKAERYIAKLQEWFPDIQVVDTKLNPGGIANTILIQLVRRL